jgi:type VI secretion system secreted protein Hcp
MREAAMAQGDMFLKIEGSRQGVIKGESQDHKHKDEIDVVAWSWGMQGQTIRGQSAAAKTSVSAVTLTKRVDRATTALMSCLRSNELIKKATLTVRKAGGPDAIEYFKITLEKARITDYKTFSGGGEDPSQLQEEISIAFNKINVEYRQQGADGLAQGASVFETDISEGSDA